MNINYEKRKIYHPSEDQIKQINEELILFDKEPSYNEILENIYIGNYKFALDYDLLLKEGITYILNCGNGLKNFYENENIFNYLYIPIYDSDSQKLDKYLDKTNKFIKEGSENGNKILIHCGAGVSRSATICLMYMIMEKKYKYSEAITLMRQKRKCVMPNMGFRKLLEQKSYEIHKSF